MKKQYIKPSIEIIPVDPANVIAASIGVDEGEYNGAAGAPKRPSPRDFWNSLGLDETDE